MDEFNKIMSCNYDIWCLTLYNLLPADEQPYHEYLNEITPVKIDNENIESKYLHDTISLQEYEDLKFPDRKRKKDEESKSYPLPYVYSTCRICQGENIGLIKCQNCDYMACISCIKREFLDPETKSGCFLLFHRRFCLKLGKLPECIIEFAQESAYLRELRDTGKK